MVLKSERGGNLSLTAVPTDDICQEGLPRAVYGILSLFQKCLFDFAHFKKWPYRFLYNCVFVHIYQLFPGFSSICCDLTPRGEDQHIDGLKPGNNWYIILPNIYEFWTETNSIFSTGNDVFDSTFR